MNRCATRWILGVMCFGGWGSGVWGPPRVVGNPAVWLDEKPSRGDSSTLRGGPERTGQFLDARLPEKPAVLWFVISDVAMHDPVYADGVVYVGDDAGTITAFDATTGDRLWRNRDDMRRRSQVYPAPTVSGDLVLISSKKGVEALSRADGACQWVFSCKQGTIESSPLVVGDLVVVGGQDGNINALDRATGEVRWSRDIVEDAPSTEEERGKAGMARDDRARPGSAASDGITVFQPIFDQSRVVALDLKTGDRRWSHKTEGWVGPAPTVQGDLVVMVSQDGHAYGLDKATGRVRWTSKFGSYLECGPAIHGDAVYAGDCDGTFRRLDSRSGKTVWEFSTKPDGENTALYSSPMLCGDLVVFGSFNGYLYGLATETGAVRWKLMPVENSEVSSTPTTDGKHLFLTTRRLNKDQGAHALVAIGTVEERIDP